MEILTLNIETLGEDGDGVATCNGKKVYVNNALPGDMVRAQITETANSYCRASLMELIRQSRCRVKAKCPHVRQCGGCQIQEMSYASQLLYKKRKVESAMASLGKSAPKINPTLGCNQTAGFRNKAIYPIARNSEGRIVTGFYARRTHNIIESSSCLVGARENEAIMEIVIAYLNTYNIEPYNEATHQGEVRHVIIRKSFANGQLMVCIVANCRELPHCRELVMMLTHSGLDIRSISLNVNTEATNTIKGQELISLYGNGYITDKIGGIRFKISPMSFFQVNGIQTKSLYSKALNFCQLDGSETVFDIYCGVGTISLFLARSCAKVYGVESVPEAVSDAMENARLNGICNAEFIAGRAEEVIPGLAASKGIRADVVVADPPRRGCDKPVLDTIIEMRPKKMVYVSCNPKSLAKDLEYLASNGFIIKEIQPVDMFPHTAHVECVALVEPAPIIND